MYFPLSFVRLPLTLVAHVAAYCVPLSVSLYLLVTVALSMYEGHLESKERFTIKKYLLIIGKKKNMHVLSHTFTYFST